MYVRAVKETWSVVCILRSMERQEKAEVKVPVLQIWTVIVLSGRFP